VRGRCSRRHGGKRCPGAGQLDRALRAPCRATTVSGNLEVGTAHQQRFRAADRAQAARRLVERRRGAGFGCFSKRPGQSTPGWIEAGSRRCLARSRGSAAIRLARRLCQQRLHAAHALLQGSSSCFQRKSSLCLPGGMLRKSCRSRTLGILDRSFAQPRREGFAL